MEVAVVAEATRAAATVGEAAGTVAVAALAKAEGHAAVGAVLGQPTTGPPGLELTVEGGGGGGGGVRSDAPEVGRNDPYESSPCFLHKRERKA